LLRTWREEVFRGTDFARDKRLETGCVLAKAAPNRLPEKNLRPGSRSAVSTALRAKNRTMTRRNELATPFSFRRVTVGPAPAYPAVAARWADAAEQNGACFQRRSLPKFGRKAEGPFAPPAECCIIPFADIPVA
jgi:hypothetical protein